MLLKEAAKSVEDPAGQVERLLDRAIELLISPTLDNLRTVEEVLREAIVRLPEGPQSGGSPEEARAGVIARKVRLCGKLLATAEAARPGFEPPAAAYDENGAAAARAGRLHQVSYEA